ncbi:MAG: (E)-4-hydroxy-3-methylbut-2-enyl-diphosphate synthase [Chloroflexi bacterium]|nr:(E)-4-hydroxy-3-methylbut-2-enyl-diphosphate synthase [Chloroflexota bacterium]
MRAPTTLPYCASSFAYRRRRTHEVMVGRVGVGGSNPIRIQSMTTTRTQDVDATVAQAERLVKVGCEIVRITAPTVQDAKAIGEIRQRLHAHGITVPLVADIHFSPAAAMEAANHVEKVRINPGNFADSRQFAIREYSDLEYEQELERIEERFSPLVLKCKSLGVAMRVGTNHGSLSDRIMNRFGDTPLGMVESALEFLRICQKNGYPDVILSMKASNPKVMIQAYRLLVARMDEIGMTFPLHLGVTEAGNHEDGRIKSAVGIGSLLDDGIGDTIRVSLTEDPEAEIPVAERLARPYQDAGERVYLSGPLPPEMRDPYQFARHSSAEQRAGAWAAGGRETVRVLQAVEQASDAGTAVDLVGRAVALATAARPGAPPPDAVELPADSAEQRAALANLAARLADAAPSVVAAARVSPAVDDAVAAAEAGTVVHWVSASAAPPADLLRGLGVQGRALILETSAGAATIAEAVERLVGWANTAVAAGVAAPLVALATDDASVTVRAYRLLAARLAQLGLDCPLHLIAPATDNPYERLLRASVGLGSLLCDGIGDSVEVRGSDERPTTRLAFNVLQASGARISKTEYVACPSCGRTLFDLQPVTDQIKQVTGHLTGVKIAIMGCIVNGPGEMADADFGYVGGAPGKINLYVGKDVVEKNIPQSDADQRLIELIRSHGRWTEPPADPGS